MKAVIRDVWRVSILQAGPQAFPRSWGLLAAVTLVYLLSDLLVALAQGYALPASLRQTVMDTGLQALLLAAKPAKIAARSPATACCSTSRPCRWCSGTGCCR